MVIIRSWIERLQHSPIPLCPANIIPAGAQDLSFNPTKLFRSDPAMDQAIPTQKIAGRDVAQDAFPTQVCKHERLEAVNHCLDG